MREFLKRVAGAFSGDASAPAAVAPIAAQPIASALSSELRDAIDAARFSMREPTEDGPRIVVMSGALMGMFIYSREEAERRIRKAFPELDDKAVARGLRHLESRIALAVRPIIKNSRAKSSWVHGWRRRGRCIYRPRRVPGVAE